MVEWNIIDALTATHDLKRVRFNPDPHNRRRVPFVRTTYYGNKDTFPLSRLW